MPVARGRAAMLMWAMRPILLLAALLLTPFAARAAPPAAPIEPRIAIISAFAPEMELLRGRLTDPVEEVIGGVRFVRGTLEGRPVLLFLSGMSMVNAAMTTQLALDHYPVERIVFSGIAGGLDPSLDVGDVVVPDGWANYMEAVFARADGKGGFALPPFFAGQMEAAHWGMIHHRAATLQRAGQPGIEAKLWFDADPAMLAAARRAAARVTLARCAGPLCLDAQPRVVVGGKGVSASVFMDNADFRAYLFTTFAARATDMESAAVAQVAYVHGVPFIAFRSLSDLAGADPEHNQARTFFQLASDNAAAMVRAFLVELDK
jgi:adenosylhomocysteine nucleosidase